MENPIDLPCFDVNEKPAMITVVYSSASISALELLCQTFSDTFNLHISAKDLFYYDVFCDSRVYVNQDWSNCTEDLDLPNIIKNNEDKWVVREYVSTLKYQIASGKVKKPEWMIYAENYNQNEPLSPSTYLHIYPKETKYHKLAESIKNFLYSVNNISMLIPQ